MKELNLESPVQILVEWFRSRTAKESLQMPGDVDAPIHVVDLDDVLDNSPPFRKVTLVIVR